MKAAEVNYICAIEKVELRRNDKETVLMVTLRQVYNRTYVTDSCKMVKGFPAVPRFLANVNSRSRSLYAVARPSVVCLSSVTLVHPTQAVQIFGNISTAFGTLAIR